MTAPSIVIVIADDMPRNLLPYMPTVLDMQAQGTTFDNYIVSNAWCCPSRTSILTGRVPHSHLIFRNATAGGVLGGFAAYRNAGLDNETMGTIADAAGYRSCFWGKFLNNYNPNIHARANGWSDWQCSDDAFPGFDYDLGELGSVTHYGVAEEDYATDVLRDFALDAIGTTPLSTPLLMVFSVFVPHQPHSEAPRHSALFPSITYPSITQPNWDFRPSSTDPAWLRDVPALANNSGDAQTADFRGQARSVQALDEALADMIDACALAGRPTYFLFTSDNGLHMGERSLPYGKQTPFDFDCRTMLVVTGPDVEAGVTRSEIVQNQDICPFVADVAGESPPSVCQGMSFLPLLRGESPTWRNCGIIEHENPNYNPADPWGDPDDGPPAYRALRSADGLFVRYSTGELEYHNRVTDPYELYNTVGLLSDARVAAMEAALDAAIVTTTSAAALAAQTLGPEALPGGEGDLTVGTLSSFSLDGLVGLAFGAVAFSPDATHYFAAFVNGVEVTGGGYARKPMTNNTTTWSAAAGRVKSLGADVTFTTATGANWGTIDEIRIFNDATAGDELGRDSLAVPVGIDDGDTLVIEAGEIDITAAAGALSDGLAEALLDHQFGSTDYTPEATLQFAYFAGDPQGAGVEITGTGYARDTVDNDGVTWSAAASGMVRNLIDFSLGTAGAGDWVTATYWALFDAAGTGLMLSALLPTPRAVANGETETLQAGRVRARFA